ncbi:ABC transporter ATP-binding protein [Aeromonas salmonicida]|uniref:ABC-type transport system ATP-binding protein n=1 Tax=Aeromonas salmonicida subsp. pectinolytica 34mel TaxID=1324960 RepID=T0QU39_AERSA|nr:MULTISPECIES: ABC transporter ATP-binding protein [Aeromonas]ATP07658.1 ABC-type transport system ATP-binding protein [Aeromonas salmonicida subsp. pectinolytica 34mel]EQC05079.1 ABC-type multidrug transporter ATPase component [Aeromonas salmonicida subsp. pectinolytica 34mel]MDF2392468.1 ATP-binding cassette domain-containing protein [Aeromonas sp. 2MA4]TNI18270.1 ABC transporter ATP-binding protein [Aeromonas salmonicida]HEH9396710.1 ABC transporter ATP-binding protein [Aeromonas salmonic
MSELAIRAKGVSRRFGDFLAVNGLDLCVPRGQIHGFLGPNGCGKSTTLRMLTGLLTPSAGEVEVLGLSIPKQAEALRRRIGYMTQKFSLYDELTTWENLEFMGRIHGMAGQSLTARLHALLETYELTSLTRQRAGAMSGGQKQRLALAAAVIHHPDLLLLDEPTSAVDPQNRRDFWEKLFDLSEGGTTILVTTHYMDEAERCHALAIMEAGQVRAQGSPQALMDAMSTRVVEVQTRDLRLLKQQLLQLTQVRSAAQLGQRLRVLVDKELAEPVAWLQQACPALAGAAMALVRPSLEDVFVSCTGQEPGA